MTDLPYQEPLDDVYKLEITTFTLNFCYSSSTCTKSSELLLPRPITYDCCQQPILGQLLCLGLKTISGCLFISTFEIFDEFANAAWPTHYNCHYNLRDVVSQQMVHYANCIILSIEISNKCVYVEK